MKITGLQINDEIVGDFICPKEATLIVEMTQEEYQKCCVILYGNEKLEKIFTKELKR